MLVILECVWLGGEIPEVVYAKCAIGEDGDSGVVFMQV